MYNWRKRSISAPAIPLCPSTLVWVWSTSDTSTHQPLVCGQDHFRPKTHLCCQWVPTASSADESTEDVKM